MIKKLIINKSLKTIEAVYPDYDTDKIDEIKYGLESIYLSLTKVIVILLVSFFLGIFKESIIMLLFFNGLRTTAFGIHASKSWICWVSSTILFIGIPYLCLTVEVDVVIHYLIMALAVLCFCLYAPADTVKRPLVRRNRRTKFKILTLLVAFIYIILFSVTDNSFIRNVITCSMGLESVLIHPFTYRVFKLPYRNYERYVFSK